MTSASPRQIDPSEVPALLAELEAVGSSVSEFARERGIAAWRLYEARRKAGQGGPARRRRPTPSTLIPVELENPPGHTDSSFEVLLPRGLRVLVHSGFDASELARLIQALAC